MVALAKYQSFAQDANGNVISSPTVEVRRESDSALVSVFANRDGTGSLGNPFTGDGDGLIAFHVAGGSYKITVTKAGFSRVFRYVAIGTLGEYDIDSPLPSFCLQPPVTKTGTSGSQATGDSTLIMNASGTYTLTLLSAVTYPGRWLFIKNIAAQTVNSASSNVVPLNGGAAGTALLTNSIGKWAALQSDGSNWIIILAN